MIRDVSNKTINEALRRLRNELVKCDGTEGRAQARRNARRRALSAMRLLRAALDREYPAIIERGEVVRRAPGSRMKALRKAGWEEVTDADAAAFAAAGVRIKRVAWKTRAVNPQPAVYVKGKGHVLQPPIVFVQEHHELYAPKWAIAIGPNNPTRLREAKRSVVVRNAVLAEQALSLAGTEGVNRKNTLMQRRLAAHQAAFNRRLEAAA